MEHAYFRPLPEGTAPPVSDSALEPRFVRLEEVPGLPVVPGLVLQPVFGERCMVSFVHMQPNTVAPVHAHPEEQLGTVLEGECEFELNGEKRIIRKGDVYIVPPHVPHGARTFDQPCLALDLFAPPRAGFQELMAQQQPPVKEEQA